MQNIQILGGVKIDASGGVALLDYFTGENLSQNLVSQDFPADTATLFIPLKNKVKNFRLAAIKISYVDTANVNDLANVFLLEGTSATDVTQQMKYIWNSGAVAETPLTSTPTVWYLDPPRPVSLDTAGRLYFTTKWTTTVISCGAGEHFYILVYGYKDTGNI